MNVLFGRRLSSIVLGALFLAELAPCALHAQSTQNPNNSTNSQTPPPNSQSTPTKKSKKSSTGGTSSSTGYKKASN